MQNTRQEIYDHLLEINSTKWIEEQLTGKDPEVQASMAQGLVWLVLDHQGIYHWKKLANIDGPGSGNIGREILNIDIFDTLCSMLDDSEPSQVHAIGAEALAKIAQRRNSSGLWYESFRPPSIRNT